MTDNCWLVAARMWLGFTGFGGPPLGRAVRAGLAPIPTHALPLAEVRPAFACHAPPARDKPIRASFAWMLGCNGTSQAAQGDRLGVSLARLRRARRTSLSIAVHAGLAPIPMHALPLAEVRPAFACHVPPARGKPVRASSARIPRCIGIAQAARDLARLGHGPRAPQSPAAIRVRQPSSISNIPQFFGRTKHQQFFQVI